MPLGVTLCVVHLHDATFSHLGDDPLGDRVCNLHRGGQVTETRKPNGLFTLSKGRRASLLSGIGRVSLSVQVARHRS